MSGLINTGEKAADGRRVLFLDPDTGIRYDLKPDWKPAYGIVRRGLLGPNGEKAVLIRENRTGIECTISEESALVNPKVR